MEENLRAAALARRAEAMAWESLARLQEPVPPLRPGEVVPAKARPAQRPASKPAAEPAPKEVRGRSQKRGRSSAGRSQKLGRSSAERPVAAKAEAAQADPEGSDEDEQYSYTYELESGDDEREDSPLPVQAKVHWSTLRPRRPEVKVRSPTPARSSWQKQKSPRRREPEKKREVNRERPKEFKEKDKQKSCRSKEPEGRSIRLASVARSRPPAASYTGDGEPEIVALEKCFHRFDDEATRRMARSLVPTDFAEKTERQQKRWIDHFRKNQFEWRVHVEGGFRQHLIEAGNLEVYTSFTKARQMSYYWCWREGNLGDPASWRRKKWWTSWAGEEKNSYKQSGKYQDDWGHHEPEGVDGLSGSVQGEKKDGGDLAGGGPGGELGAPGEAPFPGQVAVPNVHPEGPEGGGGERVIRGMSPSSEDL